MKSPKSPHSGELEGWWEDPDDPVHILNKCAPAMLDLWKDENVKQRLAEKRLRLEESSGLCVRYSPLSDSLPQHIIPTVTWTRSPGLRQRSTFQQTVCSATSHYFLSYLRGTTVDVLKARLKTTGVVEHVFTIKTAEFRGLTWRVCLAALTAMMLPKLDARYTMLEAPESSDTLGLPFSMTVRITPQPGRFRDSSNVSVNAIIFLAPISTFDQVLAEVGPL